MGWEVGELGGINETEGEGGWVPEGGRVKGGGEVGKIGGRERGDRAIGEETDKGGEKGCEGERMPSTSSDDQLL